METIEPNDNLLDLPAALTTSQKILVQAVRDAIKAHEAERSKHDAELEAQVQRIADAWDAAHKQTKSGWKLVRDVATNIAGLIDKWFLGK